MTDSGSHGPVAGSLPAAGASWSVAPQELAHVALDERGGVAVATVSGEVDMSSVDHVAAALTDLSNRAIGLVVDLRGVEYLDSSGISLLHDLALRLRRRTQLFVIVCPPGSPPRRMLELTALTAQVAVLDELEPAIATVRSAYGEASEQTRE